MSYTGFSANDEMFYTILPSEPTLALDSVDILYNIVERNLLVHVLHTLGHDLRSAGLVGKKVTLGELGARTLLLIARDFAAPMDGSRRNVLRPVPFPIFDCNQPKI